MRNLIVAAVTAALVSAPGMALAQDPPSNSGPVLGAQAPRPEVETEKKKSGLLTTVAGAVGGVAASAAGTAAGGPLGGAAAGLAGRKAGEGVGGFFGKLFGKKKKAEPVQMAAVGNPPPEPPEPSLAPAPDIAPPAVDVPPLAVAAAAADSAQDTSAEAPILDLIATPD